MTDSPPGRKDSRRGLFPRLRGYFLAGVLVTAPIAITLYVTWVFLVWVDSKVTPLIPEAYHPQSYLPFSIPGLGLVIAIAFFIAVGWFTRNILGRFIVRLSEHIFSRLPVVSAVYRTVKQIFETLMSGGRGQAFREVVMFEYPRPGVWTIGFVANRSPDAARAVGGDDLVNIFLPTTPSPTNGILLLIRRRDLHMLDMSVEEAFKLILSGGILTPGAGAPAASDQRA